MDEENEMEETVIEEVQEPSQTVSVQELELETLRREAKDFKEKYMLQLAETENMRKRLQKEKDELTQYALQNILVEFLHPLDHLENALKFADQASDDVRHWAQGFQMILTQFRDVLNNYGVAPFESEGKAFDPHFHEAVEVVTTTEHPPGIVIEESMRGYRMGDKTIRPARVKVSKAPPEELSEEELTQENQEGE